MLVLRRRGISSKSLLPKLIGVGVEEEEEKGIAGIELFCCEDMFRNIRGVVGNENTSELKLEERRRRHRRCIAWPGRPSLYLPLLWLLWYCCSFVGSCD